MVGRGACLLYYVSSVCSQWYSTVCQRLTLALQQRCIHVHSSGSASGDHVLLEDMRSLGCPLAQELGVNVAAVAAVVSVYLRRRSGKKAVGGGYDAI